MATPEVNTLGFVGGSAVSSKDPVSVCRFCFNLNPELVPLVQEHVGAFFRKDGIKVILTQGGLMSASAARGCISCAVLLEGVLAHCSVLCDDVDWNPQENLNEVEIGFYPKSGLLLHASFETVLVSDPTRQPTPLDCYVEFYTRNGDPHLFPAFRFSGGEMPTNLSLDRCIEILKSWLDECSTNHPACNPPFPSKSQLPIRILDVSCLESGFVRLVESSHIQYKKYIALSHCWGEVHPITTVKSNLRDHFNQIPVRQLPATFRDAVMVTSALKIHSLWIDSLCIVQDDLDDWETEAKKMATVYRSSYLTLSALHSPNSQGGCFSSRYTKQHSVQENDKLTLMVPNESKPIQYRSVGNVMHSIMTRLIPENAHSLFLGSRPNDTPLGSRGWALQERLMSSRTLYFHYEELVWECQARLACECSGIQQYESLRKPTPPRSTFFLFSTKSNIHLEKNSSRETVLYQWLRLVTIYSTLKLSKRSDVLPAISGLARHFSGLAPLGVYLAGLWSCDLARSMLWEYAHVPHCDNTHTSILHDESMVSWSWASIVSGLGEQCQASYQDILMFGFYQDDQFNAEPEGSLGSTIQDSSVNPFRISSDKRLRVSGLFITVEYQVRRLFGFSLVLSFNGTELWFIPDADFSSPGPYQTIEGELLCCILVSRSISHGHEKPLQWVIVLKASKEQGVFRRVGFLKDHSLGKGKRWFENAEVATIIIA